jgi:hypothetical protein
MDGMYKGYTAGLYIPSIKIQNKKDGILEWVDNQKSTKWITRFYRSRFEDLSKHLFETTLVEASTLCISNFRDSKYHYSEVEPLVGNLIFTINDFINNFYITISIHMEFGLIYLKK